MFHEPYLQNERVMVPFRDFFESIGYVVTWDGEKSQIMCNNDKNRITISLIDNIMVINQSEIHLKDELRIHNNRAFIQVRFIVEALEYWVGWDNRYRVVYINEFEWE